MEPLHVAAMLAGRGALCVPLQAQAACWVCAAGKLGRREARCASVLAGSSRRAPRTPNCRTWPAAHWPLIRAASLEVHSANLESVVQVRGGAGCFGGRCLHALLREVAGAGWRQRNPPLHWHSGSQRNAPPSNLAGTLARPPTHPPTSLDSPRRPPAGCCATGAAAGGRLQPCGGGARCRSGWQLAAQRVCLAAMSTAQVCARPAHNLAM